MCGGAGRIKFVCVDVCYLSGEIFFGDFDAEIDEFVLSLPSSWYSKLAGISLARTALYIGRSKVRRLCPEEYIFFLGCDFVWFY